jgi:hypothetical protein
VPSWTGSEDKEVRFGWEDRIKLNYFILETRIKIIYLLSKILGFGVFTTQMEVPAILETGIKKQKQ